jgi:hypothetical protein
VGSPLQIFPATKKHKGTDGFPLAFVLLCASLWHLSMNSVHHQSASVSQQNG